MATTRPRRLTAKEIRATAHPLRLRILELLAEGPATSASLARELGESTGSTSYHLRALGDAGLIEEDEGRGDGRERWWRRPERLVLASTAADESPEYRAAAASARAVMLEREERVLGRYLAGEERLPDEWRAAAFVGNWIVHATPAEVEELSETFLRLMQELRRPADERPVDAVPVLLSFRALPRD